MSLSNAMRGARMITAGRGRIAAGTDAVTIDQAATSTGASRRAIQMALQLLRSGDQRLIDLVDNRRMTLNRACSLMNSEVRLDEEDQAPVVAAPSGDTLELVCTAVRSLIAGGVDVRRFVDSFQEGTERVRAVRALELFATQAFDIVDEEDGLSAAAEQQAIAGSTRVRAARRRRREQQTVGEAMMPAAEPTGRRIPASDGNGTPF